MFPYPGVAGTKKSRAELHSFHPDTKHEGASGILDLQATASSLALGKSTHIDSRTREQNDAFVIRTSAS
jgi:hypothetical protein